MRLGIAIFLFAGGVHWISVGKLNDESKGEDSELLQHLQTLIRRLDKSGQSLPSNVKSATDYLQEVSLNK